MSDTSGGIVINLNAYGATVRLDDGDLASASAFDVETHRDQYQRSLARRKRLRSRCGVKGGVAPSRSRPSFATIRSKSRLRRTSRAPKNGSRPMASRRPSDISCARSAEPRIFESKHQVSRALLGVRG